MKRTLYPVLLVVLVLLCASTLRVSAALADDDGDRLQRPGVARLQSLVVDTTGEPGDDSGGDPDTLGGGYGVKKTDDLLGGSSSSEDEQEAIWMELMLQFMDLFPIVR